MTMRKITVWDDGDNSVTLDQDEQTGLFRVTYGLLITDNLTYPQAAKDFGQCMFHSLACAGKLDNEEGDEE